MKKIIVGILALSSATAFANERIVCSKSTFGQTYKAVVTLDGATATVGISASSNSQTRSGSQSEGPIAYQVFSAVSQRSINNVNLIAMDLPVSDPDSGEVQLSYAEIHQSGSEFTLLVKGKALPWLNRIKFKNCN